MSTIEKSRAKDSIEKDSNSSNCSNSNHGHKEEEEEEEEQEQNETVVTSSSSSEAAGVARGAARTASTITRKSLVGRLPKSSAARSSTTTTAAARSTVAVSRTSSGRILPKKVPVKHVAKVSDRISAGLDAYDAAMSSTSSSGGSSGSSSSSSSNSGSGNRTATATTTTTTITVTKAGTNYCNSNNNKSSSKNSNRNSSHGNNQQKQKMDTTRVAVGATPLPIHSSTPFGIVTRVRGGVKNGICLQQWKSYGGDRVVSFAKTMVTNTVLGTAVFQMYEEAIVYFDKCNSRNSKEQMVPTAIVNDDDDDDDAYQRTMVSQHFVSGLMAGSVHSILQMSFQSIEYFLQQQQQHTQWQQQQQQQHPMRNNRWNPIAAVTSSFPSFHCLASWSICHTIHHAMAHAMLFSTYEGTKRVLQQNVMIIGNDNHDDKKILYNKNYKMSEHHEYLVDDGKHQYEHENTLQHAVVIGLAGGIAGQIQHVVSHYTESWLQVGENDSPWTHSRKKLKVRDVLFAHDWKIWRRNGPPSLRSILMAFPPSAIGFIAFEYGKMLMD